MRNKASAILAAALAAGSLAACTTPSRTPSAASPILPASPSSPSSTPASAPSSPPPAPSVSTSTGGSGTGGGSTSNTRKSAATWNSVDFAKVMFRQLGCPDEPAADGLADVRGHAWADLTGDGRKDPIWAASCMASTSAHPNLIVVFDGARPSADPKPLVVIGRGQDLVTEVAIKTSGRTLTVSSKALSAKAALCCPDFYVTQSYKWDGSRFNRTSLTKEPLKTP